MTGRQTDGRTDRRLPTLLGLGLKCYSSEKKVNDRYLFLIAFQILIFLHHCRKKIFFDKSALCYSTCLFAIPMICVSTAGLYKGTLRVRIPRSTISYHYPNLCTHPNTGSIFTIHIYTINPSLLIQFIRITR